MKIFFLSIFVITFSVCISQDIGLAPYNIFQLKSEKEITAVALSGSGKYLLAGDEDGNICNWNLESKILLTSFKINRGINFLAFLGSEKYFVCVDEKGNIFIYDLLKGQAQTSFKCKSEPKKVALDAGKQYLAVATDNNRIEIVDLSALMPAGLIDAQDKIDNLLFFGFDRLGQQLIAVTEKAQVVSWNPSTLRQIREISLSGGELHGSRTIIHSAATNRASNVFVIGLQEIAIPKGGITNGKDLMRNNLVIAYDWNTGMEIKRIKTNAVIDKMALGPGNDHVVTINNYDNNITMIDLRKGEIGSSAVVEEKPSVLTVSDDNNWIAVGTKKGQVSVWKIKFKENSTVQSPSLPSLSGRIRTKSGTDPLLNPGKPIRLAIVNFEAKGLSQEIADICLNSLSNALSNFDYITLIERKQIESILKEQQFQHSDMTEENGVRVGKLLNADDVLLCSVGKLGSSMVFSARLISVETGAAKGRDVLCEECRDQDIYDAIIMLSSTIAQ